MRWNTPQGETYGRVEKRLTSATAVGCQKANASEGDPRHVVEGEKSGGDATSPARWTRHKRRHEVWRTTTASRP